MVFILIGAVKAAKHARHEFNKDKKRSAVIAPVEGSHDMMADRASSSAPTPSGATDWWGTMHNPDAPPPTPDAPANHAGVGAWSRDQIMQQIADARAETSASNSDLSTSASAELSPHIHRASAGPSASASPSEAVRPTSQRGADITLPESISHDDQQHGTRSEEHEPSSLVNSPSQEEKLSALSKKRSSLEFNGEVDKPQSPVKQQSRNEATGAERKQHAKGVVDGSFEAAMRRKPSIREESLPNAGPQGTGETVSALPRNASKGHKKRPSQTDERMSMVGRYESMGPSTIPLSLGTTANQAVSALARNCSKGPRRRLERPIQVSQVAGSFEASIEHGKADGAGNETSAKVEGGAADERKCVSALAGASTKKRVGRRPPTVVQSRGAAAAQPMTTGDAMSSDTVTGTAVTGTTIAGSSMYVEGCMKKRTSRR